MNYLIDTNVISEPTRKKPSINVLNWLSSVNESQLYISVMTIGELQKGISKLKPSQKKQQQLTCWFDQLKIRFNGRILAIDEPLADFWGNLSAEITQPTPVVDSLIASTALYHHCTLVTRNTKEFELFNLSLINPWH